MAPILVGNYCLLHRAVATVKMQQIDLETGHRIAVKREPAIAHTEAPQYFITFAIRGLQNSPEVAKQAVVRKFRCTVNFTADLLPKLMYHVIGKIYY